MNGSDKHGRHDQHRNHGDPVRLQFGAVERDSHFIEFVFEFRASHIADADQWNIETFETHRLCPPLHLRETDIAR